MNGKRGRCIRESDKGNGWWVVKLSSGTSVNVKVENMKRLDEPTAEMPAAEAAQSRAPVVMRMPGEIPSRAVVEAHNLAHLPSAPWCEICIAAKGSMDQ